MSTTTRRRALSAAGAVLALALAGCSGDHDVTAGSPMRQGSMHPTSGAATSADPSAGHDQADVMFSMMMVPHHEQALEMAELVPSRSDDPALRDLAQRIEQEQQPEIDRMRGWLDSWGAGSTSGTGSMGHSMTGMMSEGDMAELASLKGAAFDRRWLTMMVEHHEGAIEMAQDVLRAGRHEGTRELAAAVIETQQREIDEMTAMLAS
ncbi:DUF305 domain-containing protein [Phycicoccus sp. MAQZ13P-2]|uniref:DUF305 domain-containing protein n=1 Tax=Phycicoccus mangrovi TaxID=2840470 RepID=UPI001BFFEEB9|nr:DUF305 domain-containing protein [Phycicoccus mangrovi]MBT9255237.1 DUF305 domain-containing protein [Phycicoccus mangrovi]MBT9274221.1 DUF305 domain-containing protein [Phycicoccus mangrovi]